MFKRICFCLALSSLVSASAFAQSRDYKTDEPRPIPLTRPELKQLIEDVKFRTPRIPLPELTEADRQALGQSADSYESRLRYHYLNATPRGGQRGGGIRTLRGRGEQEANMSLDYGFKVELFWIVSRMNNCQYCLGHQESKLLGAGLSEDQIAALDCDWSIFSAAERAAFEFARKYTHEPHLLATSDIESLRKHYTDMQILEMMLSMS